MIFSEREFEAILADPSKIIEGDLKWTEDEDKSPTLKFRVEVQSEPGYPLFISASCNRALPALTYSLIHRGVGRIYGLCYGKDHHNPACERVGDKHKHRWTDLYKDKQAHIPSDITAAANDPVLVWRQFCAEAKIRHQGQIESPPLLQEVLF